eukprot:scaffold4130_cov67-Isochrysis_galbana.AAC.1
MSTVPSCAGDIHCRGKPESGARPPHPSTPATLRWMCVTRVWAPPLHGHWGRGRARTEGDGSHQVGGGRDKTGRRDVWRFA